MTDAERTVTMTESDVAEPQPDAALTGWTWVLESYSGGGEPPESVAVPEGVRSTLDFDLLRFISNPPAAKAEGLGCAIRQIPKRDRRDGVTTLKCATAHGPGFLTGSHATKIISAAPFRPQSSGNAFLSHRERAALRSVFWKARSAKPAC